MSNVRHSIDRDSIGVDNFGRTVGFCNVCKQRGRAFTFFTIAKNGERVVTYRCGTAIAERQTNKRLAQQGMGHRTRKQELAVTLSLGSDVSAWESEQAGHCGMCQLLVPMNPHTKVRALYAVSTGVNKLLRGLFCWDCRTLLNERVSQRMSVVMDNVVARGDVDVLPPDK
jgi:hypothetical protein